MTIEKRMPLLLLFATLLALTGCWEREPMNVPVASYNYTDHSVISIWVNKGWVGSVSYKQGGGSTCCVSLPYRYAPGTRITLDWDRYDCTVSNNECATKYKDKDWPIKRIHKVVEVPPYQAKDVAELQLAFLPNDEVRVYAESRGFRHVDHPSHKEFGTLLEWNRPLEGQWPKPNTTKPEASR
ncbi:hypothetical protein VI26_11825 [Chromobacterium sp. LK1]|uniref:DUF3304 domain-containing protein n=1 Tax=Chromobacterium sp. LK1 TaxID=1628193 RepID=UPI0006529D7E|nr:DUF3304 domain-containing protein [Chromobacterium sp. LK1]KMN35342.1 hypothetical protein VI26_11825 [Chromobacterium sp. LK1]